MIDLNELFAKRAKYENEIVELDNKKVFVSAKIAVVDEFIADEQAKCIEQPETVAEEENTEEETLVDQDEE